MPTRVCSAKIALLLYTPINQYRSLAKPVTCLIFDQSALRGQPKTLVTNSLVSLTQTAADVTSDDTFFLRIDLEHYDQ